MARKKKNAPATLDEIMLFWTEILRDSESDLKDRLKVSELLAKLYGNEYAASESEAADTLSLTEAAALIARAAKNLPDLPATDTKV